jgi:hypothetical protein
VLVTLCRVLRRQALKWINLSQSALFWSNHARRKVTP